MDQSPKRTLRRRQPPKQGSTHTSMTGQPEPATNDEGGLMLPFSIGVICLVLAMAAFLLLSLVSMSNGLTLFLNILFPLVSLIGIISIGIWWKKDVSRFKGNLTSTFKNDLAYAFSNNRVISFIILFVTFAFALSLILIAPIFVITPIITGNSLLFSIGGSLADASAAVQALAIFSSVALFIAGLFLLHSVGKYSATYIASCNPNYPMTDSFSPHISRRGSVAKTSDAKLLETGADTDDDEAPDAKVTHEADVSDVSIADIFKSNVITGNSSNSTASVKTTTTVVPVRTNGQSGSSHVDVQEERPPSRMVVGSAPGPHDDSHLNSQPS